MSKKTALVTGGNRGIGFETCRQLLEEGYRVLLTARDEEKGRRSLKTLHDFGPDVHFHALDVTDENSIAALKETIMKAYGGLEVLINNAAIHYDTWQQALDADMQQVQDAIQTNLIGPWRMIQAFAPQMRERGYGRIVNVSSEAGSLESMGAGTPAYGVTKAALNALTIKVAAELKGSGVLVNTVCPGWVRTDMGGSMAPRSVEQGAASVMWAVMLDDEGPTGGFFRDGKQLPW